MLSPKMQELYDAVAEFVEMENQDGLTPPLKVLIKSDWINVECKKDQPFYGIDKLSIILNNYDATWFILSPFENMIRVAAQVR